MEGTQRDRGNLTKAFCGQKAIKVIFQFYSPTLSNADELHEEEEGDLQLNVKNKLWKRNLSVENHAENSHLTLTLGRVEWRRKNSKVNHLKLKLVRAKASRHLS